MSRNLVRVNKYSKLISELPPWKRIATDYPLLCRDVVAKKLAKMADRLPEGYFLQIDSAYRGRKIEQILWKSRGKLGIVSDPSKGYSSHATGGAIDIALLDNKRAEINLSSPLKKYYDEPKLHSKKISKRAQKLRLLIHKLMLQENFAPNPKEYWHFSYGSEAWAKYYHKKQLFYETFLGKKDYYSIAERIYFRGVRYLFKFLRFITHKETNY